MNEYKVTVTIESNEEKEKLVFITEADSFEEAVENIKADLDI